MTGEFFKIVAVILIVSVLAVLLRSRLAEYSFLLSAAVVCSVIVFALGYIFPQIQKIQSLFEKSGNSVVYFTVALKALGISYIADFAENICRDFGLNALAQATDIVSKGTIFILSVPLICAVLECALKFVGL